MGTLRVWLFDQLTDNARIAYENNGQANNAPSMLRNVPTRTATATRPTIIASNKLPRVSGDSWPVARTLTLPAFRPICGDL